MDSELAAYIARRTEVLAKIRRMLVVSLNLRRKPELIDPDTSLFGTGLGIDSIDAVEIVVALEIEFGVKIPDPIDRRRSLRSVNALVDLVMASPPGKLKEKTLDPSLDSARDERSRAELTAKMTALRTASTVTRMTHVHALRLQGAGALDLLDAVTTSRLFARENQMLQTLLLDQTGTPFAEAFVCLEEDSWILFAEGPSHAELLAHLQRIRQARAPSADVTVIDLLETHALWSVDGPYAWEVVSTLLGPEVLGAPYLTFLTQKEILCFRAGKTGEYGYLLLVPQALAAATWAKLHEIGAPLGMVEADLATLDQCALENWHFNIRSLRRRQPPIPLGPAELQLQWRVELDKEFEGVEELRRRRTAGSTRRLTCFVSKRPIAPGDVVEFDQQPIGEVVDSGWSSTRGDWVGWATLDVGLAWPGIRRFVVVTVEGPVPIETSSPPLLDNRSLFVDPRKHRFRTRAEDEFPPLVSR